MGKGGRDDVGTSKTFSYDDPQRSLGSDETLTADSAGHSDTVTADSAGHSDTVAADSAGHSETVAADSHDPGTTEPGDFRVLHEVSRDNYLRRGELARGGMGRIVDARDRRHGRPVAIKELLSSDRSSARFEREARVTAGLQHPGIVPIYEAGVWPDGEPFFAMKLVEGRSLAAVIDDTDDLDGRLALLPNVIAVAEALAYAHSRRVIHRDLKPANVLVGRFGETVVIDWGLAKELASTDDDEIDGSNRATDDGLLTVAGSAMGTPAYMPPEQARGESVDERSDVYALGAILYHVLTGTWPYHGAQSARQLIERVLEGAPRQVTDLEPEVPPDLAAIVETAMARSPAERYRNAEDMVKDLRRFQTGQLVGAHNYSTSALIGRFVRRHRNVLTAVAVMTALLIGLGAFAVTQIITERDRIRAQHKETQRQKRSAEAARGRAESSSRSLILQQARALLNSNPTRSVALLKRLSPAAPEWKEVANVAAEAIDRGVARHVLRGHKGHISSTLVLSPHQVLSSGLDGTVRLWDTRSRTHRTLLDHPVPVIELVGTPDGQQVFATTNDGALMTWDTRSWKRTELIRKGSTIDVPNISPDGAWLVASVGGTELLVVDIRQGATRRVRLRGHGNVYSSIDARSEHACVGGASGDLQRVNLATGSVVLVEAGSGRISSCVFSPKGGKLSWIRDQHVIVLDETTKQRWSVEMKRPERVYFDNSGTRLVVGSVNAIAVWRFGKQPPEELARHTAWIAAGKMLPRNHHFIYTTDDGKVRLIDVRTGGALALGGHQGWAPFSVSNDGAWMASGGSLGAVHVWDMRTAGQRVLSGHTGVLRLLAFGSNDQVVSVSGTKDEGWRVWSLAQGSVRAVRGGVGLRACDSAPGGRHHACVGQDAVWQLDLHDTLARTARRRPVSQPISLAFSNKGERLAVATKKGGIHVFKVTSDEVVTILPPVQSAAVQLAFTPSGSLLSTHEDGRVLVWDLNKKSNRELGRHGTNGYRVECTPDGGAAVTTGVDNTARLWPLTGGAPVVLRGHTDRVLDVAMRPNSEHLATVAKDGSARLYDRTGKQLRAFETESTFAKTVRFTPDGKLLVVGALDAAHVWNLETHTHRRLAPGRLYWHLVAISPDGTRLAVADRRANVRLFTLAASVDRAWLDRATSAVIGPNEQVATPTKLAGD